MLSARLRLKLETNLSSLLGTMDRSDTPDQKLIAGSSFSHYSTPTRHIFSRSTTYLDSSSHSSLLTRKQQRGSTA